MLSSGDSLTDSEAGVPNALYVAAWPEDHMVLADFDRSFEESSEEDSGPPGENFMSHGNLGLSPGASIDLSGKYCNKNVRHFIWVARFYICTLSRSIKASKKHYSLKVKGGKNSRNPNEKKSL